VPRSMEMSLEKIPRNFLNMGPPWVGLAKK
jgi:hypothetical protein